MPPEIEDLIFRAEPKINSVLAALELVNSVNYAQWCGRVASVLSKEELWSTIEERSVFARISKDLAHWAYSRA
jgi:hypothetical protein